MEENQGLVLIVLKNCLVQDLCAMKEESSLHKYNIQLSLEVSIERFQLSI